MSLPYRSITLCASLLSALFHLLCALRILLSWRALRWDFSGVDDTSTFPTIVDPLHLLWGMCTLYFVTAATASIIGFVGIVRNSLSYVRFYRDFTIADLLSMMMSALTLSYLSFSSSSATLKASVCDELGRQPELLREVAESGLDLENCEYWFEKGIVLLIAMYMVFVVVKVHFVLALSKYYSQLRNANLGCPPWYTPAEAQSMPLERIYLLPTPTSPSHPSFHPSQFDEKAAARAHDVSYNDAADGRAESVMVYAPVPLGRVSIEEGHGMGMREAWLPPSPTRKHYRHHSHSHAHHHRASRSSTKSHGRHRSTEAPENQSI